MKGLFYFSMNLPWYEYGLWFAVIIAKAVLFYVCRPIQKMAFLKIFTVYTLLYELIAGVIFFIYPKEYNQFIWILDFIKYYLYAMLATQLATIKEHKYVSIYSFMGLCTIAFGFVYSVQIHNTESLLRLVRFIDGICIGIASLVTFQKMEKLYKNIAIGLSGILAGDFLCSTIQAYDQWKHWAVVRPLYALVYLISLVVLIHLTYFGKGVSFLYVRDEHLSPLSVEPAPVFPELIPAQQHLLYPELYLP